MELFRSFFFSLCKSVRKELCDIWTVRIYMYWRYVNNPTIVIMSWWCNLGNGDMENQPYVGTNEWTIWHDLPMRNMAAKQWNNDPGIHLVWSKQAHNIKKSNKGIRKCGNSCEIQMGYNIQYNYFGLIVWVSDCLWQWMYEIMAI